MQTHQQSSNKGNFALTNSAVEVDALGLVILMHNDAAFAKLSLESAAREWAHAPNLITVLVSGSEDGTDQIAMEWVRQFPKESSPRVHIASHNLGPLGGLIRLLELSFSTHVAVLQGDDLLLEGFLEGSLQALSKRMEPSLFIRDFMELREAEPGIWQPTQEVERSLVSQSKQWNQYALSVYGTAALGGSILPVQFCLDILRDYDSRLLCAEDWLLFNLALDHGARLVRIAQASYGYRIHAGSISNTNLQSFSVGFVRGCLSKQERGLMGWVARQQAGRELMRIDDSEEYLKGLSAALCSESPITQEDLPRGWRSIPFLTSLWVFRRLNKWTKLWHG